MQHVSEHAVGVHSLCSLDPCTRVPPRSALLSPSVLQVCIVHNAGGSRL